MHQWKLHAPDIGSKVSKFERKTTTKREKNAPSVPLRVRLVRFRFRGSVGSSICKSADALLLALPG